MLTAPELAAGWRGDRGHRALPVPGLKGQPADLMAYPARAALTQDIVMA
jgi:hypothetical protein